MSRNVRMPDGTIIRGVPDGVSKDEFNAGLIERYGQEKFDQMTGATKAALSPDGRDVEGRTEFGRDVVAARDKPLPEMTPSMEEMSDSPEGRAHRRTHGTWAEQAARKRAEAGEPPTPEPTPKFTAQQKRDRDFLTQHQLLEEQGEDPEKLLREKGAMIRRLVDLDIYEPEHYRIPQEDFDRITFDRVTAEMKAKKEMSQRAEKAGVAPDQAKENAERGWWNFTKKAIGSVPDQIATGLELKKDTTDRIEQQNLMLGQLHLESLAAVLPETGDVGKKVVEQAAAKHNLDTEGYAKYSAMMVDMLTQNERATLGRAIDIIEEVQAVKPETDSWFGHIGAMAIENSAQLGYIVAGVATRNPVVTMSLFGTDVYARSYAGARSEGRSPDEAAQDAFFSTVIEAATEAVPVSKFISLMKAGEKSAARKLLEALGTEAAQEVLAESLQVGYDIGIVGDDMTIGEAAARVRDAGVLGGLMGATIGTPVAIFGDNKMANAQEKVNEAKKDLRSIALRVQNPKERVTKKEIDAAKKTYADAVKAKGELIIEREKAKLEKKKAKTEKKEAKRKKKLTPVEARQEAAAEAAEKADQSVTGPLTNEDLQMAEWIERAGKAELEEGDAAAVQAMLEAGYIKVTKAGTPVVLPAGKRRLEAVRAAQEGAAPAVEDEVIEPTPFVSAKKKEEMAAVEEEIGRRMRGEQVIEPKPFTSQQKRRQQIDARVDEKIQDPAVREKIVDSIIKAEQIEQTFDEREAAVAKETEEKRDADYQTALDEQTDVELGVAKNLAALDEKGVSGYKGTRLGDVLRNAMNIIEKQEAAATKALEDAFWNKPTQGTLFDVSGALAKGTADYANLVKVGALKLTKHGLKYSAWTADMIGQFGESIRPVMARVFHDAKKAVNDVMKLSHEKFLSGPRKGEMRFAPKQYAKPGQIRRLRRVMEKLAAEGEAGRFWYEKSGKEILRIVGGDKKLARKLAGLLAIYSSGTSVSANTTNALKMWAQFTGTAGEIRMPRQGTLAGRFGKQDRLAIEWLKSTEEDQHFVESFGDKRFPFFQNIMREIDPKNYEAGQGVTVDLWMMRALGYDRDAPTDAQFAFVATEIKALADKLGWEKQQVQAAIWVAIKSRWEFIQKQAKQRAVDQGLAEFNPGPKGTVLFEVIGANREEQIENEKKIITLFRGEALKASIKDLSRKFDESKADFADMMEKHYGVISWEAEPSTKLGSALNRMSLEDKIAMQAEMAELFVNPETGREYIAEWLDLLGADQIVGPGAWEMNLGSVVQNSVIIPVKHKPATKAVQQEAKNTMDGYAAIMGFLLKQDAVAWHKPFYGETLKASNGVEILTRGILSAEKTLALYEAMYEATGDMGFAPIVLNNATRVLNFTAMPNREFHKMVAAAADKAGVAGDIEVFQSDGNLVTNDWRTNKRGQEYVEAINNNENPQVKEAFERAKRKFAGRVAQIYAKYSGEKTDARISASRVGKDTKLKRTPRGHIRFRHFGKKDVGTLRVEKAGTGIRGAERAQTKNIIPVISAYPNTGFKKEVGLGNNEYVIDVPKEQLYDANADPMNLRERAQVPQTHKLVKGKMKAVGFRFDQQTFEQLIKDAGFVGYYTPKAKGNLKGQARFFGSIVVDNASAKKAPEVEAAFSISDRPRITVMENELDEFEVREKDGEVYYTDDADDAISTARHIYGADATVVIVDTDGSVITTDVATTKPERIKLGPRDPDDAGAVSEFLDEWFELTEANPLSPDERVLDGTSAVELRPQGGIIWLDSVRSFEKGKGMGSQALKTIIELADMHGVTLKLTAKPFSTGGNELLFNDLVNWYERNGFIKEHEEGGYVPSAVMVRAARNPGADVAYQMFKRPKNMTNDGYGVDRQKAETFIAEHFGSFYGLVNFEVLDGVEQLPDDVYGQIAFFGYGDRVRGVYHDDAILGPTIYVITNNLYVNDFRSPNYGQPDITGMIELVLHETIGHFGLRALLGKNYNKVMDAIIKGLPKDVQFRGRGLSQNLNGRRLAAEEVVAYLAEEFLNGRELKANQLSVWGRFMNAAKVALATMGLRKMTHNDIANLVLRAHTFVKNNSQEVLQKRARMVTKMREAQKAIDKAQEGVHFDEFEDFAASLRYRPLKDGSKAVYSDGKMIGRLMPGASEEVLRSSPGIQEWSKEGEDSGQTVQMFDRGQSAKEFSRLMGEKAIEWFDGGATVAKFSEYWEKMYQKTYPLAAKEEFDDTAMSVGWRNAKKKMPIGLKQARKDDPALDRFMMKIGHGHYKRLVALRDWWELGRANLAREFEISMLDQFAGIKHMEQELSILGAESGYMSVRLTAGTDVIIRSAIERGVPMWDADGSVRTDHETEGLLQILAPIAQNSEMLKAFEAFLVARRARRLKKEQRERLFSREEIGAALKFIRQKKLYKLFKETADDLAAYKSKVLDFAQEAGLIDPVSRKMWEHNDHVPFYRVLAEENTKGPFSASRIGHIGKVIHRLKGGTDPLKNPLEAIVQNLSMLIEASVKNRAMADVIRNFDGTGVVTKAPQAEMTTALIPMKQIKDMLFENGVSLDAVGQDLLDGIQKLVALQAPTANNIISVQENGTKQYYYVHDPGVLKGLDNVSPNQWYWLMKILRLPKRILTRSITLMPDFILKNWFRDIWHAYVLSRSGTVLPIYDSARGWTKAIIQDDTYQDIMAGGGMFDSGYVNASDPKKTNTAIRAGVLGEGRHNILDTPRKLARFYMRIANGAENAHRIIVYEKTLKKTGSRKQALFEARDLMDFSVRGANPIVRFLTETVPFWGARVQGIARTGKGFKESPATTFMRAAPIVLASMALYGLNRDDERYKKLNPYEKRMYYHFYDVFEKGDHYRLPKPFEVGAIFSTFPEIMMELSLSEESDRGKQAAQAFGWTVAEMLMLAPDVQAINPVYELLINENRFTDTPILTEWEKDLDPKDRFTFRTSATIRELAQKMPESAPEWMRSPKQLEHLVRGYLGSGIDYALAASDMIFMKELNGGVEPPLLRWDETPFFKSFKREPEGKYDIYLESMYSVLEEANKIHNSINRNKKLPRSAKVDARIEQLRTDNEALLYARGPMNDASRDVSKVNKHIKKIYADPKMTPEEKRIEVDVLLKKRSKIAEEVYDYRPGGKLNKFEGGDPEDSYYDQVTDFLNELIGKPKDEQVDELIGAHLPHTATLINDITISEAKLRRIV